MNAIAGIDLTINEAAGNVSGVALLHFQVGSAQPLLSPQVEGKTLAFEVERRTCNQCEQLISKYRMELTGPNEARLWMVDDQDANKRSGPEVKMVRRTEPASWHDSSKHQVQFVIVEYSIRLEVLDWGGAGRPVVLLAGSGNTPRIRQRITPASINLVAGSQKTTGCGGTRWHGRPTVTPNPCGERLGKAAQFLWTGVHKGLAVNGQSTTIRRFSSLSTAAHQDSTTAIPNLARTLPCFPRFHNAHHNKKAYLFAFGVPVGVSALSIL